LEDAPCTHRPPRIDRILKGASPGDPGPTADHYKLIINLKTAKAVASPFLGMPTSPEIR
jgi:hypothetical protein